MRRIALVLLLLLSLAVAGCGACIPAPAPGDASLIHPFPGSHGATGSADGKAARPPGPRVLDPELRLHPGAPGFCWTQLHLRRDRVGGEFRVRGVGK